MIKIEEVRGTSSCNSCGLKIDLLDVTIGRNSQSGTTISLCLGCRADLSLALNSSVIGEIKKKGL